MAGLATYSNIMRTRTHGQAHGALNAVKRTESGNRGRTDLWDHARYHRQDERGAYDTEIGNGTKVISTTVEKGSRKGPTGSVIHAVCAHSIRFLRSSTLSTKWR